MQLARIIVSSIVFFATLADAAPGGVPVPGRTLANTYSTDVSGLWYNPQESGWGVNIIQQSDIIFATMFVYDSSGKPTWFFASDVRPSTFGPGDAITFTGVLYSAVGSPFDAVFNPGLFAATAVGTISLAFSSPYAATLTYVVHGTTVTKSILPQTWRANLLGGIYSGTMTATGNCALPLAQPNGLINFQITEVASNATVQITDPTSARCTLTGPVTQYGKLIDIAGTYSCTGNKTGTFTLRRIDAGVEGFMGEGTFSQAPECATALSRLGAARLQ